MEFLFVAMIIYGIGFGLFSPPNTNVIMGSVPPKDTSVASAAVATMRTVGQAMSMGILTLVFAFVMGNVPMIEQYYPLLITSCQITCLICVVLCIASVFASFVGIKSSDV
jgi:MFS family permease